MDNPNKRAPTPPLKGAFPLTIIVTTARGCEQALAEDIYECLNLVGDPIPMEHLLIRAASVTLKAHWGHVVFLNLMLRCASRVLLQVTEIPLHGGKVDLFDAVLKYPWPKWFGVHNSFAVYGSIAQQSWHQSAPAVTLKIKDAIADCMRMRFNKRPDVDKYEPDVGVYFRIQDDVLSLCLDTTGHTLEKRGYRLEAGDAPLKESIAASLIRYAGWRPTLASEQGPQTAEHSLVFLDPFCGSGTLVIEAALAAKRRFPQLGRNAFAFQRLLPYQGACAPEFLDVCKDRVRSFEFLSQQLIGAKFWGSDQDDFAVQVAKRNAERAGVADLVNFSVGEFSQLQPPSPVGLLLTNPPFGVRLEQTHELFSEMGHVFKRRFGNWTCFVYSGSEEGNKSIGLRPARKIKIPNGNLPATLLKFPMRPLA